MTGGGRQDDGGAGGPAGTTRDAVGDLVSLLYGELSADEERAVRGRLAGDPALAGQLAELESVRELYRGMADEEPPARVTAQILAQAAQAAGRRTSRGPIAGSGFWSRLGAWLQPLVAHPGLTAAASLILVVGVAGVLLLRRGAELTRTEPALTRSASPERTFPETGSAPATSAAPDSTGSEEGRSAELERDRGAPPASLDGVAKTRTRLATRQDDDARRQVEGKRSRRERSEGQNAGRAGAGSALGLKEEAAPALADSSANGAAAPPAPARSEALGPAEKAESSAASAPAASPPAPAAKKASGETERVEGSAAAGAPAGPTPPSGRTGNPSADTERSPQALHRRALIAAARHRCIEVRSLGQEIRRLDLVYHDKFFRPDKRLASCLSSSKPVKTR